MRKGRHVDRSVLSWPACVSLALDYELSRDPPPNSFISLCCISRPGGVGEWVGVVRVQLSSWNGCEHGGCLREKSTGVKNWTWSSLFSDEIGQVGGRHTGGGLWKSG